MRFVTPWKRAPIEETDAAGAEADSGGGGDAPPLIATECLLSAAVIYGLLEVRRSRKLLCIMPSAFCTLSDGCGACAMEA